MQNTVRIEDYFSLFAKTDEEKLKMIIKFEAIKPVYQPIVSLKDGQIYGYEALSRISDEALKMNIEQLFKTADKINRAWELESLCRDKAMKHSTLMCSGKKLFLNVNPNIIHDEKFKEGFTKDRLTKYQLDINNIIFEITERTAIMDSKVFLEAIEHYREQNYGIAIDDVGAGYSGLNAIANVRPHLLKLDIHLIRDIDKDETKRLLCKAMVDFCQSADILLVAEGVETEDELETLIKLNIDFMKPCCRVKVWVWPNIC